MPTLNLTSNVDIFLRVHAAGAGAAVAGVQNNLRKLSGAVAGVANETKREFPQVAGAFTSLFVAREIGRVMMAAIQPAMSYQQALASLQAQTGATAEQAGELGQAARRAARETRFSPEEAIDGMIRLRQAGIGVVDATQLIGPVLEFAQIRGLEAGEAARVAGYMYKQFNMTAGQLTNGLAVLDSTFRTLGVPMESTGDVIAKLGTAAMRSGASFENMAITFGLAARGIGSTTAAATELNRVYADLTTPRKRAAFTAAFDVAIVNSKGQFRDLSDVLVEVSERHKDMSLVALQNRLAQAGLSDIGKRALIPMLGALRNGIRDVTGQTYYGAKALIVLRTQQLNAARDFKTAGDAIRSTMGFALENLGETLRDLFIVMGMPAVSSLGEAVAKVAEKIQGFVRFLEDNPWAATLASGVFKVTIGLLGLFTVGLFVSGAFRIIYVASHFAFGGLLRVMKQAILTSLSFVKLHVSSGRAAISMRAITPGMRSLMGIAPSLGKGLMNMAIAAATFAAAFYTAKYVTLGMVVILEKLQPRQHAATLAILEEVQERGYLNSLIGASVDLYNQITDADMAREAALTAVARATKAATRAQEDLNDAMTNYRSNVSKALQQRFPPRILASDINRGVDALRQMQHAQGSVGEAARRGLAAYNDLLPILARMSAGERLSAEDTTMLMTRLGQMQTNVGLLGPTFDAAYEGLDKSRKAAEQFGNAANVGGRNISQLSGTQAQMAASTEGMALGFDRLVTALNQSAEAAERLGRAMRGESPRAGRAPRGPRTRTGRAAEAAGQLAGIRARAPERALEVTLLGLINPIAGFALAVHQQQEAARLMQRAAGVISKGVPVHITESGEGPRSLTGQVAAAPTR